jgi:hypothetical protein
VGKHGDAQTIAGYANEQGGSYVGLHEDSQLALFWEYPAACGGDRSLCSPVVGSLCTRTPPSAPMCVRA